MHSFIIIGASAEKRLAEAKSRASTQSTGVDLVIIETPKSIDSAREIKSSLTRRPYQSLAITIILVEAQSLTIEAQNALLKTLEEPPGPTQIYLTAQTVDSFLPTVRSRCHLIDLGPIETSLNEEDLKKAWTLWREGRLGKLFDATDIEPSVWAMLGRAFLLHQLGTDEKEISPVIGEGEIKKFTDQLNAADLQKFLKACQHTSELLSQNINRKLAMENLFLKLPRPTSHS